MYVSLEDLSFGYKYRALKAFSNLQKILFNSTTILNLQFTLKRLLINYSATFLFYYVS